jgi:hypothetical protein
MLCEKMIAPPLLAYSISIAFLYIFLLHMMMLYCASAPRCHVMMINDYNDNGGALPVDFDVSALLL